MNLYMKLVMVFWPGVCGVAWAFLMLREPWQTFYFKCIAFAYIVLAPGVVYAFYEDYKTDRKFKAKP